MGLESCKGTLQCSKENMRSKVQLEAMYIAQTDDNSVWSQLWTNEVLMIWLQKTSSLWKF